MRNTISKYFILISQVFVLILITQKCFGAEFTAVNQQKLPELPEPIQTLTIQHNTTTPVQTNKQTELTLPSNETQEKTEQDNNDITNIPLIIKKDQYDIDTKELTIEEHNTDSSITKLKEDIQDYNPEFTDPKIEEDTTIIKPIDKREYIRFSNTNLTSKITVSKTNYLNNILDISRGGIGFVKSNKEYNLEVGDTIHLEITYKNISIPLDIQILAITNNRICTKYINLTEEQENKILYLNITLEADNNMLTTKKIIG